MKGPALAVSLAALAAAGFGAAHALADASPQQVTLPTTTLPATVTVTLPVTTATVPLPTVSVPLPTTTAPLPTTTAPLPTTTASAPSVATTSPSSSPAPAAPASSSPGVGSGVAAGASAPAGPTRAGRRSRDGLTVETTGRRGRRVQSLGFRLGRPAKIVAVFRGPAPSCEIAFTYRGRGRQGANRVPASALVRKGIVEAGIYAVRVVAVRGEQRRKIGEVVVDVRRLQVRRLPRDRHRCAVTAPRGVLAAAGPTLGGPVPPPEGVPPRRSGVAPGPEIELPRPLPAVEDPSDLPAALFFGAIALALIALAGMGVSVARALR